LDPQYLQKWPKQENCQTQIGAESNFAYWILAKISLEESILELLCKLSQISQNFAIQIKPVFGRVHG
jgi:hypothetical protein